MVINVNNTFPNMQFASCPLCGILMGFKEEDVLHFTCNAHPKVIKAITCIECDNLLLIEEGFVNLDEEDEDEEPFSDNLL